LPSICTSSTLAKLLACQFFCVLIFLCSPHSLAQIKSVPSVIVSPPIKWNRQTGISRYRLQIATDARFQNVLLDRLVHTDEYHPSDLIPGYYYWRVAPSEDAMGRFLPPLPFQVTATIRKVAASPAKPVESKPPSLSWFTATGPLKALLAAPSGDFIAINKADVIYAIDSTSGIPRWTTRVWAKEWGNGGTFRPLFAKRSQATSLLLFAIGTELRAVDTSSGAQLWSTALRSRPVAGTIDSNGRDAENVYVIDSQNRLYVVDAEGGRIRKEVKLRHQAVGRVSLVPGKGVLVPTADQTLELYGFNGKFLKEIQVKGDITASPLAAKTSRGLILLVGTRQGIAAFDTATWRPLGLLTFDNGEYPVSEPVAAELDNDIDPEVLTITNRGSVAAVDSDLGKLKWLARVATTSATLSVVDVNGDGSSDVVIPGNTGAAMALSSVDGSVVWQAAESSENLDSEFLLTQRSRDGRLLVAVCRSSGVAGFELQPGPKR